MVSSSDRTSVEGRRTKLFPIGYLPLDPRPLSPRLRAPSLAAAVVFGVAETFPSCSGHAEIKLLHVFVACKIGRWTIHDYPAVFQDVAVIGVAQGDIGILLGQQEAHLFMFVQAPHDRKDFVDDLRR